MRRAFLLAGLVAGTTLLFTVAVATVPSKSDRLKAHLDKMRELAFCQKGYEIASSFPSYASRRVQDVNLRIALLHRADRLEAKSEHLDRVLATEMKTEAQKLGMDPFVYDAQLVDIKTRAEMEAVLVFQQAEEPLEVLSQLDKVCASHITE